MKVQVEFHGVTLHCDVTYKNDDLEILSIECEEDIFPLLDRTMTNDKLERLHDAVQYEAKVGV